MMTHTTTIETRSASENHANTVKRIALTGLVILAVLLSSAVAEAGDAKTHDGFHMRWGVGVVAAAGAGEGENAPYSFVAPGILDGIQLGGCIKENLSLFVEADSLILFSVNKNIKNTRESENKSHDDETIYGFMTGIGAGHYIMPANIYLSGAVGATYNNVVVGDEGTSFDSHNIGLGFTVMAGKEWWVSDGWGVGLGGQFFYMANKGKNTNKFTSNTIAFGMLLTATYN
ncbi:MAG: hypothetical protein GY847_11930 [Proteobacteria bacterium]|nr:hypothetical protein [Pseudomonadota bacterium]